MSTTSQQNEAGWGVGTVISENQLFEALEFLKKIPHYENRKPQKEIKPPLFKEDIVAGFGKPMTITGGNINNVINKVPSVDLHLANYKQKRGV